MTVSQPVQVSCIVPAYNEGPRLRAVLEALLAQPLIDEIIVVDDGSSDDTVAVAQAIAGVVVHRMGQNGGKTRALAAGIARARGDSLLFIDADLSGLAADDLERLIAPVRAGRADMSISLRRNAPRPWHWIGLDYISGERMMRRALLEDGLDELAALPRFGFEVWLNRRCVAHRARIAVVRWDAVDSPLKSAKFGVWAGVKADLRMMGDLFSSASPIELLRQIVQMRRQVI
ncbi:Undecaprenyl-phosphate 4-deoxy-4-formamido-L-arabinose transferase [Aquimixticola soesokkakensis]|uniref:Undecaprenyl-phosphate 4-deoxy-4-formamido-L-arabinose transferase n=1 Tax=Aquimixticola soesokkakensis TaxID=1519096 RepID=A0A1Y5SYX1_9RHOB|nr:glycosyltransferase family 2 protein [Aquimixticola soesokkakensis]SLN48321.1 Undecaprenyl-phosphate 4-deoxy-4-formamido-L-arabinose transferase [Aquimixticola soesokkakensis]